jgi:hypothetical protein
MRNLECQSSRVDLIIVSLNRLHPRNFLVLLSGIDLQMICTKQCLYLLVVEKYHYEVHIVIEGKFGGNEEGGGSVACGDAILISMSRDRPGLSGG